MAHEILNFKSENEDLPFYDITFLYFLYHYYITSLAGMQVKPTEQVKTAYMITTYEFPNIPLEKSRFWRLGWENVRDVPNNDPK